MGHRKSALLSPPKALNVGKQCRRLTCDLCLIWVLMGDPPSHRLIGSPTAGLRHALLMVSKLLSVLIVAALIIILIW